MSAPAAFVVALMGFLVTVMLFIGIAKVVHSLIWDEGKKWRVMRYKHGKMLWVQYRTFFCFWKDVKNSDGKRIIFEDFLEARKYIRDSKDVAEKKQIEKEKSRKLTIVVHME